MSYKAGWQGKMYRANSTLADANANTANAASWLECAKISNVKVGTTESKGDTTVRLNGGIKTEAPVLTVISVDFDSPLDITDADYIALETAAVTKVPIALAFMSGNIATNGERGWVGNWMLEKLDRDEQGDKEMRISYTAVPYSFPQYYKP